jgi:hypothetical protein
VTRVLFAGSAERWRTWASTTCSRTTTPAECRAASRVGGVVPRWLTHRVRRFLGRPPHLRAPRHHLVLPRPRHRRDAGRRDQRGSSGSHVVAGRLATGLLTVVLDENADPTNATLGPGGDFPAQIFVINADGSELRQLTHDGDNRWPTWSPDGSRIALRARSVDARDGSRRHPSRLRAARHPTAHHHDFRRDRCSAGGGSQSRRSDRLEPGSVTHLGSPMNSTFEAMVHAVAALGGATDLAV